MKVLLTGATGFLGSVLVERLAEHGHEINVLHRRSSNLAPIEQYVSKAFVADITDPLLCVSAARGMDAIVHLAADMSHWSQNRDRVFRTNVIGTRIMAEAAKTAAVPTLIHTSSIAAVGYSPDGTPIDESAENNFIPLHLIYHESKRQAEEEALDAVRYGVRVVVVNPGVIYGPRELSHPFGHTMLELANHKIPGHPTGGISIVDVLDVADGMVAALDRGRSGERYLFAGHNVTYEESFKQQAVAIGTTYSGRPLPAPMLTAAARVFELRARFTGKEPRLTIDNAKIAPLRMWYASSKAKRELGFATRPLEETFSRMGESYRRAGLLQ